MSTEILASFAKAIKPKTKSQMANSQFSSVQFANMRKNQSFSIFITITIYWVVVFVDALPTNVPRYNQLGYKPSEQTNSSSYNNNVTHTTDRLGAKYSEQTVTTPTPQFEYALLGQDPEDQHWYRVSLTSANNKSGYRAQFATRKSPPFDAQLAHKHDKTIQDLLNFLEKSEDHSLLKVYGQLLANEDQESKIKRNVDNELDNDDQIEDKVLLNTNDNRPLLLVGEMPGTATPTSAQNGTDSSMVNNFVYFIKGLK